MLLYGLLILVLRRAKKNIDEYRFRVALKLFPRIAATDQKLKEKLGDNGKIYLLIFYINKQEQARQLIEILSDDIPRIGNIFQAKINHN